MQKLIPLLSLCFCTLSLPAQYSLLVDRDGEVPVVDVVRFPDKNSFDVARIPGSYLNFPAAVSTGGRGILAAYIRTDSVRSIGMARSADGGRTWTIEGFPNEWDGGEFHSLSLFNLGHPRPAVGMRRSRRTAHLRNSLMLFSGGNPILAASSRTEGEYWSDFYPANRFGGFRITGLVRLKEGRHMALLHDDGRFLFRQEEDPAAPSLRKSVIYKIYSADGGLTWSEPEIALKHNLHGLYDAVVFYSPAGREKELVMIAGERETGAACISFSADEGQNWSYPERLPSFIRGDRFGAAVFRRHLILAFRDLGRTLNDGSPNPTFGDLVMWTGDLRQLLHGDRGGLKIRVADNYPTPEPVDYNDRKWADCGYPSVLPLSPEEICVIACGRWEEGGQPFVRNFPVDPAAIRHYMKNREPFSGF